MKKYIATSHLLNNFTGSPFVLSQVVIVLKNNNIPVKQFIGNKKGEGFLTQIEGDKDYSFYSFCQNKLLRMFFVFGAELHLFLKMIFKLSRKNCHLIYANTLYSFGAALAGKLRGIPVVYHVHETSLKPEILKKFLRYIVSITSHKNIYVSQTHFQQESIKGISSVVLYNSLESSFYNTAINTEYQWKESFEVLMVCSLKEYKGINEFIDIIKKVQNKSNIKFTLVLNASDFDIEKYFKFCEKFDNLKIYSSQKDLIPFYNEASLVLNLSRPDQWVETFGLTILEAMTFGIPVIAPPVGGPTELVDDGENGFLISCYETDKIASKILELSKDKEKCMQLSEKARDKAMQFSPEIFEKNILKLINEY